MSATATNDTAGSVLQRLSDELAGAVEAAGGSVVRVNARRRLPATGIVWSVDGDEAVVVSASHVVERDEDITITTPDGVELPATLAGRDQRSDLVVLRVTGGGLSAATRAGADDIRIGALVLAIGRAAELAATIGVVSALGGPWGRGEGRPHGHGGNGRGGRGGRHERGGRRHDTLIASDAPMFPGFSGGPLVDAGGRVLGLLSSHIGRGQTLAVPSDEVDRIVEALLSHGRVRRGYLGIGAQQVNLPASIRAAQQLEQEQALLLVTVEEGGPADRAGLTIGDIIVALAGRPVQGLDDLRAVLGPDNVGQSVAARVLRGGQPSEVTVTVGETSTT